MPNPNQPLRPAFSPVFDELLNPRPDATSEILAALRRIEEKLNPSQSLIITGAEVERVIKSLRDEK